MNIKPKSLVIKMNDREKYVKIGKNLNPDIERQIKLIYNNRFSKRAEKFRDKHRYRIIRK